MGGVVWGLGHGVGGGKVAELCHIVWAGVVGAVIGVGIVGAEWRRRNIGRLHLRIGLYKGKRVVE